MAGDRVRLEVRPRTEVGTRVSRRLRRAGLVPGVLYGRGDAQPFAVEERVLRRAIGGEHGMHTILDVVVEGEGATHHAVLKSYQLDPRRSTLLHVDLHEVRLDRPIQAQVTIELVGDPEGVSRGGVLTQVLREASVEALPMAVPDRLELDVAHLEIGDSARVADIVVPDGVTVLDDPDALVAAVGAPRRAEEAVEEGVEAEEEAVEAGAEAPAAEAEGGASTAEADAGE